MTTEELQRLMEVHKEAGDDSLEDLLVFEGGDVSCSFHQLLGFNH